MDSQESEMNLYFKIIKSGAVKVKQSETIENLKVMLREKEGVADDIRDLFFWGDHLHPSQRISDYAIRENSTIHLYCRERIRVVLYFKMPSNGKIIKLEVLENDTIQKIKSIIQEKERISAYDFEIYYSCRLLENHRTVASINIQGEAMLHLISNPKDNGFIYVQTPTEEVIKVGVKWMHTVLDVKKIIESRINIPSQAMKLVVNGNGEQLQDSKTLSSYSIKENDILTVQTLPEEIERRNEVQIFVKTWSGKTVTLNVKLSVTIQDIKYKLYKKCLIPVDHHSILFNGRQLEVGRDLESYNVQKHSTLHMVLNPRSSSLVTMKLSRFGVGRYTPATATISELIDLAKAKWKLTIKEIVFQGSSLKETETLAKYQLGADSIVDCVM